MSKNKTAIVFCCEFGILEKLSKLLINSLVKYSQMTNDMAIYCFCPRKRFMPRKSTLEYFEKSNVKLITENLNKNYAYYPLFNKVVACEYIEKFTNNDYIIFIDSDTIIINDLFTSQDISSPDISVQSEYLSLVSALTENDDYYHYWSRIFKFLNIKVFKYSELFVLGTNSIAYWNSGFFISKLSLGLMNQWKENLDFLFRKYHWRNLEYFFLEQVTFSATIQQMDLKVNVLPKSYNYPISMHESIRPENKVDSIDDLVVLHYLKEYLATIENLRKISMTSKEKVSWIEDQFKSLEIFPVSFKTGLIDVIQNQRNINLQKGLYFIHKFKNRQ